MQIDLRVQNIVLVGIFDLRIFDKYFFIKNEVFKDEEIMPNSVLNDSLVSHLFTNDHYILLSSNQIVITANNATTGGNISSICKKIITSATNQTITAFGFNFNWFLVDQTRDMESISSELFYCKENKLLSKFFDSDSSMFGAYASKDFLNSRLKLDIKPNTIEHANSKQSFLNFAFNFHFDVKDKSTNNDLLENLEIYSRYGEESALIISIYKD